MLQENDLGGPLLQLVLVTTLESVVSLFSGVLQLLLQPLELLLPSLTKSTYYRNHIVRENCDLSLEFLGTP